MCFRITGTAENNTVTAGWLPVSVNCEYMNGMMQFKLRAKSNKITLLQQHYPPKFGLQVIRPLT